MRTHHLLIYIAALFIILISSEAYACSCVPLPPPKEALQQSNAVFAGRVIDITPPFLSTSSLDANRVRFAVSHIWKGTLPEMITIHTAQSSASCGYPFQKGEAYLVYANVIDGKLTAGLCSRTAPINQAQTDLVLLGAPVTNRASGEQQSTFGESMILALFLIALLFSIIILCTLFLFTKRRRRKKGVKAKGTNI